MKSSLRVGLAEFPSAELVRTSLLSTLLDKFAREVPKWSGALVSVLRKASHFEAAANEAR